MLWRSANFSVGRGSYNQPGVLRSTRKGTCPSPGPRTSNTRLDFSPHTWPAGPAPEWERQNVQNTSGKPTLRSPSLTDAPEAAFLQTFPWEADLTAKVELLGEEERAERDGRPFLLGLLQSPRCSLCWITKRLSLWAKTANLAGADPHSTRITVPGYPKSENGSRTLHPQNTQVLWAQLMQTPQCEWEGDLFSICGKGLVK